MKFGFKFMRKTRFNFTNLSNSGQGQGMTLTLDTHLAWLNAPTNFEITDSELEMCL